MSKVVDWEIKGSYVTDKKWQLNIYYGGGVTQSFNSDSIDELIQIRKEL
mgnify:CR=1 FL=1